MKSQRAAACRCDSGLDYVACCGPLHAGDPAAHAVSLMRSRYCAYVLDLRDYLLQTWHPRTRPETLDAPAPGLQWLGLEVVSSTADGAEAAEVTFVARYRIGGGRAVRMKEASRFLREDGRWYYLDGVHA